jgi:predicted ATP-grasp superfamily ATP-dependent carboligase
MYAEALRAVEGPASAAAPAVVVGCCAHGLAVIRALAPLCIPIYAVESNRRLPGLATRHATVRFIADTNTERLIPELAALGSELLRAHQGQKPVLFLTNDNMSGVIARSWPALESIFRLSWSDCTDLTAELLLKSAHQRFAERAGLLYPKTLQVAHPNDLSALADGMPYPLIAKPARPLASFKVRVLSSASELEEFVASNRHELPILIQPFVAGGDECIHFCALFLRDGEVLAQFAGRKLRSRPMGHTTVAEPSDDSDVIQATRRFFGPLRMSGPVSLELKRDPQGKLWVIEPTVGRTDFWIGLCVANGANFLRTEYLTQVGARRPMPLPQATSKFVWLNTERDPLALPWYVAQALRRRFRVRRMTFPYLCKDDLQPFWRALRVFMVHTTARALRWTKKRMRHGLLGRTV